MLAGLGLDPEELRQTLQVPATPITHIHLYHCDHLGTPQALIDPLGQVDWQMELDPWGNTHKEYNRLKLYQPIRMQGQCLDSGPRAPKPARRLRSVQLAGTAPAPACARARLRYTCQPCSFIACSLQVAETGEPGPGASLST